MASPLPRSDAKFDASLMAEDVLDRVLDQDSEIANAERAKEVAVAEELKKKKLLAAESERIRSRVLFITSDSSVTEKGSATQTKFLELAEVFDEIHVILFGRYAGLKRETVRLAEKVWVYPTAARWFIRQAAAAETVARRQLQFTDGFRPDIVIALDPFESGWAALKIAHHFDRPWQVHVLNDDFRDEKKFLTLDKNNKKRLQYFTKVMREAESVRVTTESLKTELLRRFRQIPEIELLPRFYNAHYLLSLPSEPEQDLFPQFSFTMLFIGELNTESTLFRTLDAVRAILQTPSIGLVVVGDGVRKEQFRERTKLLGINQQVLFLNQAPDLVPLLQSADVLIVTDTSTESEDLVVKAAAAGTPLVLARTALRSDLFTDGLDAFLVEADDTLGFHKKILQFLNANALRTQFATNEREVVRTRIEEDPQMYRLAYRDSIERVLYAVETNNAVAPPPVPAVAAKPKTVVVDGMEMRVPQT